LQLPEYSALGQKRKGSARANVFRFSTESRRGPARLAHPLRAKRRPRSKWLRPSPTTFLSELHHVARRVPMPEEVCERDASSASNLPASVQLGAICNTAPAEASAESVAGAAPLTVKLAPGSVWNAASVSLYDGVWRSPPVSRAGEVTLRPSQRPEM